MHAKTNIARALLVMCCAFALFGCSTTNPKETFFRQHPDLKSKYVRFDEASPEVIQDFRSQAYGSETAIIRGFCEHFPQYSDVTNYAGLVRSRVDQFHEGDVKFDKQLEEDFDRKSDLLFYYDYHDGNFQEQGWLILRHNQIFKTYWISRGHSTEP
jgi:hypothetical protein